MSPLEEQMYQMLHAKRQAEHRRDALVRDYGKAAGAMFDMYMAIPHAEVSERLTIFNITASNKAREEREKGNA